MKTTFHRCGYLAVIMILLLFTVNCVKKKAIIVGSEKYRDNSLAQVYLTKKIRIGASNQYPPFIQKTTNNSVVGYDADLIKEVTDRLGVEAEFSFFSPQNLEAALSSGRIDCIWSGFNKTIARSQKFNLSKPYLRTAEIVITKKNLKTDNLALLRSSHISLVKSFSADSMTILQNTFGKFTKISFYPNVIDLYDALDQGKSLAIISNLLTMNTMITKKKQAIKIVGKPIATLDFVIAFPKNKKTLKNKVEKILLDMYEDQTVLELSRKWFGVDISIIGR